MTLAEKVTQAVRKASGRPPARLLTVKSAWYLTPNMIRVVFVGPELEGFPEGREGGNCKLMFPEVGETKDSFADRLAKGPAPVRRTQHRSALGATEQSQAETYRAGVFFVSRKVRC